MKEYTTAELLTKVETALREFFDKDIDLLCLDAHEISITHKIAEHLQRRFKDLKVDCEYNRRGRNLERPGDNLKKLLDNRNRRPDIVVHKRGCKSSNTLVVEVKKSNSEALNDDGYKLEELTRVRGDFGYRLGLFLEFGVGDQSGLNHAECYQDGEKQCEEKQSCRCRSLVEEFGSSQSGQRIDRCA